MSGKSTPGPWAAKMSRYHEESLLVQAGHPSNRVLARFGSDIEPLDDIDRANAHLIAAAPDMAEILERTLAYLEGTSPLDRSGGIKNAELRKSVSAVLSRARGEATS